MPQLDKATIFSQVFWLIFLYFIFFIGFLKYYLPRFSKLFKVRGYIMSLSKNKDYGVSSEVKASSSLPIFTQFSMSLDPTLACIIKVHSKTLYLYDSVVLKNTNNLFKVVYLGGSLRLSIFKDLDFFSNGIEAN